MPSVFGKLFSVVGKVIPSRSFQIVFIVGCGAASYYFYTMRNRRVSTDPTLSNETSNLPRSDATDDTEAPSDNLDSFSSSVDTPLQPEMLVPGTSLEGNDPSAPGPSDDRAKNKKRMAKIFDDVTDSSTDVTDSDVEIEQEETVDMKIPTSESDAGGVHLLLEEMNDSNTSDDVSSNFSDEVF